MLRYPEPDAERHQPHERRDAKEGGVLQQATKSATKVDDSVSRMKTRRIPTLRSP